MAIFSAPPTTGDVNGTVAGEPVVDSNGTSKRPLNRDTDNDHEGADGTDPAMHDPNKGYLPGELVSSDDEGDEEDVEEIRKDVPVWRMDVRGLYKPPTIQDRTPKVGMIFPDLISGINFYREYACSCGFASRLGTDRKTEKGVELKYVLCAKQGHRYVKHKHAGGNKASAVKRRCVTTRTGCKAMISLKLMPNKRYQIVKFIEVHNHPIFSVADYQNLRSSRNLGRVHKEFIINCQKACLGPTMAHKVCSSFMGGDEYVGATVTDFRNFVRDLKVFIGGSDVQMVLDEFEREKSLDEGFYYEYDYDDCDRLTRLFWADSTSIQNYHKYGDCVTYDSTYGTNRYSMVFSPFTGVDNHERCVTFGAALLSKEDTGSFVWVFECFLRAMNMKQPKCIITDQDGAMKNAISQVMPAAKHRLCMWHIMKKFGDKVGASVFQNARFIKRFNAIVWSGDITTTYFEEEWCSIMTDFSLENHAFLGAMFKIRAMWIPAYFRESPMGMMLRTTSRSESENSTFGISTEKILTLVQFMWRYSSVVKNQRSVHQKMVTQYTAGATPANSPFNTLDARSWYIFTRPLYYKIKDAIMDGGLHCFVVSITRDELVKTYEIEDYMNMSVKVELTMSSGHCKCECLRFEGFGLICMHIFCVLHNEKVREIPDSLINKRWCRDSVQLTSDGDVGNNIPPIMNEKQLLHIKIWNALTKVLSHPNTTDDEKLTILENMTNHRVLKDQPPSIVDGLTPMERLTGIVKPPAVNVHIPNVCRNKGTAKRMTSEREKATKKKASTRIRRCSYCKQDGTHDARTCDVKKRDEAILQSHSVEDPSDRDTVPQP